MLFSTENDSSTEEDMDFDDYKASSSKLCSLFAAGNENFASGNSKLIYKAPSHPQVVQKEHEKIMEKSAEIVKDNSSKARSLFAASVHAFLLCEDKFEYQGILGLAVLGNQNKEYKILLYTDNGPQRLCESALKSTLPRNTNTKQVVSQTTLKFETELNIKSGGSHIVQFFDDNSKQYWSVNFESELELFELLKWYLVSKAVKLDKKWDFEKQPLFVDAYKGNEDDKTVDINDSVEFEYVTYRILEDGLSAPPSINGRPESVRVKLGIGKISKAWEICIIGMKKCGKRLFIVPHPINGEVPADCVEDSWSIVEPSFPSVLVCATIKRVKFALVKNVLSAEQQQAHVIDKEIDDNNKDVTSSDSMTSRDVIQPIFFDSGDLNEKQLEDQRKANILSKVAKIGYSVTALPPNCRTLLCHNKDSAVVSSNAQKDSTVVGNNENRSVQQSIETMPDLIMQQQQHVLSADNGRNNPNFDARIGEQMDLPKDNTIPKIADVFFEKLANLEKMVIDQKGAINNSNIDNKERLEICIGKMNILAKKISDFSRMIENINHIAQRLESIEKTFINKFDEKLILIGNEENDLRLKSIENRLKDMENLQKSTIGVKSPQNFTEEKSSQIKKIMNSVFKTINASLDIEKTYGGDEIRSLLLKSIKECTLEALSEIVSADTSIEPIPSNTFEEKQDSVGEEVKIEDVYSEKCKNDGTKFVVDCEISHENPPPLPEETEK